MRTHARTHTHTHIHIQTHTQTHTHKYTPQTHSHTHTHTHNTHNTQEKQQQEEEEEARRQEQEAKLFASLGAQGVPTFGVQVLSNYVCQHYNYLLHKSTTQPTNEMSVKYTKVLVFWGRKKSPEIWDSTRISTQDLRVTIQMLYHMQSQPRPSF